MTIYVIDVLSRVCTAADKHKYSELITLGLYRRNCLEKNGDNIYEYSYYVIVKFKTKIGTRHLAYNVLWVRARWYL
jgi:hypothetical protein